MAELLYINTNPQSEEQSFGLQVGRVFLEEYKKNHPEDTITELNLYQMDIPLLDQEILQGWAKLKEGIAFDQLSNSEKTKIAQFDQLTEQFMTADKYVFVTPLWNLGLPPLAKAYIDTVCVAGKTFEYTEQGPQGLLKNKVALNIHACGGIYSHGSANDFEFGNKYIVGILKFLGVESVESLFVEGMAYSPEQAEDIKKQAMEKAKSLARDF